MEDLMIRIDGVKKQYRLGTIGGGTLQGDLQTWWASVRGKEDPNSKIGAKVYKKNEKYLALDGISFEVKTGERVGIIGHNGAGKSTLLKLLSRVTAPTEGQICLNGRVASMLEVGTGFHPELTGRENIYMNGAILGMTKIEIDSKMEAIIDFSECRQFIDTPVKRYSSGMYVKLAFSVAAHLDSEIMIMDEVLAVGDMAFQSKCLQKMSSVSEKEGRTILYVSHNMNTIRQLCDRVIVLDHGMLVFDGDVEDGIGKYLNISDTTNLVDVDLSGKRMKHLSTDYIAKMTRVIALNKQKMQFNMNEIIHLLLSISSYSTLDEVYIRLEVRSTDGTSIGTANLNDPFVVSKGNDTKVRMELCFEGLVPGKYEALLVLYQKNKAGSFIDLDAVFPAFMFEVRDPLNNLGIVWNDINWGKVKFKDIRIID